MPQATPLRLVRPGATRRPHQRTASPTSLQLLAKSHAAHAARAHTLAVSVATDTALLAEMLRGFTRAG